MLLNCSIPDVSNTRIEGFDFDAVPDPTTSDKILSTQGRGIYLMKALMDEISFEEGGTIVHMRKRPNAGTSDSITNHCDPTNEHCAPIAL